MKITVGEVARLLDEITLPSLAEDWDNVGLLVGRRDKNVNVILAALDFSREVLAQAEERHAELIVTHHPAIFRPLKSVTDGAWQSELLLSAAERGIAVYSAHTNLDSVSGGVNDVLAERLGLTHVESLTADESESCEGLGRIGDLPETVPLATFAELVKKVLGLNHIVYADAGRRVKRVAVLGGSGMDFRRQALVRGADTFVTADVKYHEAQDAVGLGLNVIDGTHQGTELPVMPRLADKLALLLSRRGFAAEILVAKETKILRTL